MAGAFAFSVIFLPGLVLITALLPVAAVAGVLALAATAIGAVPLLIYSVYQSLTKVPTTAPNVMRFDTENQMNTISEMSQINATDVTIHDLTSS